MTFSFDLDHGIDKLDRHRTIWHTRCDGPHLIRVDDYIRYEEGSEKPLITLCIDRLRIVKKTKHGVWVDGRDGRNHFVLEGSNGKRYAYAKVEDALKAYLHRKRWQKVHGERTIRHAELGMEIGNDFKKKLETKNAD